MLRIADDGAGYTLERRISAGAVRSQPVQNVSAARRKQHDSSDEPDDDDIDTFLSPPDFTFEEPVAWIDDDSDVPDSDGMEDSCPD